MGSFDWNSDIVFDDTRLFDGFGDSFVFSALTDGGAGSTSAASLVLDNQRGELVRAPAKLGHKGKSEAKVAAALKNHSEAEKRRRERINSHLNTLRSLLPCTEKMDKASLLTEVINYLKELKMTTIEACKDLTIPMDVDVVTVKPHEDGAEGLFCIKVSLCCEDRPEIFADLRRALATFNMKTINTEISTLGGRMKIVFVLAGISVEKKDDAEAWRQVTKSVQQTLRSILDKHSGTIDLSPTMLLSNKKCRSSLFNSSSSSS